MLFIFKAIDCGETLLFNYVKYVSCRGIMLSIIFHTHDAMKAMKHSHSLSNGGDQFIINVLHASPKLWKISLTSNGEETHYPRLNCDTSNSYLISYNRVKHTVCIAGRGNIDFLQSLLSCEVANCHALITIFTLCRFAEIRA